MSPHAEPFPSARANASAPIVDSDHDEAAPPRVRWRTMLPLIVLLALAVHALLPQLAMLEATADVLRRMRWWAVALAVGTQAASYWGNGYTIQAVARLTGDRLGTWEAIRLALAASSVGLLTGGRWDTGPRPTTGRATGG